MKASDTVMSNEQLNAIGRNILTVNFLIGDSEAKKNHLTALLRGQAEITWKAGIKEVIEWIEKNKTPCTDWEARQYQEKENIISVMRIPHVAFSIHNSEWQSKLKEWGINE